MSIRADGNLNFDTTVDPSGFKRGVTSLEGHVKGFFGNLASAAKIGAAGIGLAVAGFAVSAAKVGMEYEAQMSRVKAISGATASEMKALDDLALKLGADTSFSAREAAAGMENLASAGFDANETMKAMPGLLDLAAVSGGDVAASSEVAASTLRAFAMDAGNAGHVADVFAQAAADTNAEVADMGEAMKYIAPVAHAMGISMEETAAAIGIMSNSGIKGSEAGTSLRGALTRLAKPSKFAQEIIDRLGLSFYDTEGKMKPLKDQIGMLQKSMSGLTDQEKQNALVTLYGQESLSGMLALIDAGPEKLGALTTSFEASGGAAKDMAKTMRDNLKGNVDNMMGALESLKIKAFKSVKGALNNIVSAVGGAIQSMVNNFDDVTDALKIIFNVLKFIAPFILALYIGGKIVKGVTLLRNAWLTARAAVIAYNIQQALMIDKSAKLTVIQTIIGLITGEITLASVATRIWNAALALSPIMWVAAAVGVLITALIGYNEIVSKTETGKETQRLKDLDKAAKDAAKSIDEATASGKKQAEEGVAEMSYVSQLKDELDGLVDANGRVKKGYEARAGFIANELTKATGIEIKLQDGVIKSYDKLSGKIDEYIQKKKAQIWIDAQEEGYSAAIKNFGKFTEDYITDKAKYDKAKAAFDASMAKGVYNPSLEAAKNTAKLALDASVANVKTATDTMKTYERDAAWAAEGSWQKIIDAHDSFKVSMSSVTKMSRTELETQITDSTTDLAALKSLNAVYHSDALTAAIKDKESGIRLMKDKLAGMTSAVTEKTPTLAKGVKTMMDRVKKAGMYIDFSALGIKIPKDIQAKIKAGTPLTAAEMKILMGAIKTAGKTVDFTKTGKDAIDGIKAGIKDPKKQASLFDTIVGVMKNIVKAARRATESRSPSRVFKRLVGFPIVEGIVVGLLEKKKALYGTMSGLLDGLAGNAPMIDVGLKLPTPSIATGSVIPAMAAAAASLQSKISASIDTKPSKDSGDPEMLMQLKALLAAVKELRIENKISGRDLTTLVVSELNAHTEITGVCEVNT